MQRSYQPNQLTYFQCKEILKRSYAVTLKRNRITGLYVVTNTLASNPPYSTDNLIDAFETGKRISTKNGRPNAPRICG